MGRLGLSCQFAKAKNHAILAELKAETKNIFNFMNVEKLVMN